MHGMNLLEELQEQVVCGDGAMGTLLLDQGLPMEACLEEISVSDPERVCAIHRDYIAAGARVIETPSERMQRGWRGLVSKTALRNSTKRRRELLSKRRTAMMSVSQAASARSD